MNRTFTSLWIVERALGCNWLKFYSFDQRNNGWTIFWAKIWWHPVIEIILLITWDDLYEPIVGDRAWPWDQWPYIGSVTRLANLLHFGWLFEVHYDQIGQYFAHFGNSLKALVNFVRLYLVFGKNLNLLLQLFNANGPIITDVTGQILNN